MVYDLKKSIRNSLIASAFVLGGCASNDGVRLVNYGEELFNTAIGEPVVGVYNAVITLNPLDVSRIPARMAGRIVNSTMRLVDESIPPYSRELGEDNEFSDSYIWDGLGAGFTLGALTPLTLFEGAAVGGTFGLGADYLTKTPDPKSQ